MMSEPSQDPGEPPAVTAASNAQSAPAAATEQQIDPWSVSAATDDQGNVLAFDYEAIAKKWNTNLIDDALLQRFERLTNHKPHRYLRRGLFFSHRDFSRILDCYEKGETFMIYTGRGPSSGSLHIGHTIPFEFTKWLQDIFDMPLVIMLTDDEKYLFREGNTVEDVTKLAEENAKDILAVGFDIKKTFVFSDFNYMSGPFYQNAIEFSKLLPWNQVRGAFGFNDSTNIGRVFFPAVQCVAAFPTSYPEIWGDSPAEPRKASTAKIPCLIPMAIDQDPYFRLLRDNSHRMKNPSPKAALIHSKFLTALQGPGGKMSASDPTSAIFMTDKANDVKKKINKYAFSGGRSSVEEHRELGGNTAVDVPFQYLTYFLEDDSKLAEIKRQYESGEMLTGELKKECITIMQEYVTGFQERRSKITDDTLQAFMKPRKLEWSGNPAPKQDYFSAPVQPNPTTLEEESRREDSTLLKGDDGKAIYDVKPQRPAVATRTTTYSYSVRGLSSYGDSVTEMIYPTKSRES
ncbi:MAG: hypothetical protein M1831_003977 [Alyxoria varia]|nr:MAG: hypothetical protein M1831_003977 [Alyxoria varia]